jgi:hypothetical protein
MNENKEVWEAPTIEELDYERTENAFIGVGTDFGIYAS